MQKQARGRFIWLKDFGNVKCFHAMKEILKYLCCVIIFLHTTVLYPQVPSNYDPLPSWNEGPVKSSIISYVQKVTDSSSGHYIPPNDRIATFDNDGTLWAERPVVQELFAIHQVKKMVNK